MQVKINEYSQFAFPKELVKVHYCTRLPLNFCKEVMAPSLVMACEQEKEPTLYTAHLPKVLDWLHGLDKPQMLEEKPCKIPLLLYDQELSLERVLFHYEGTRESALLIRQFVDLFGENLKKSSATIISPCFIPKSKMKEEQELIHLIKQVTAETSFIKFNFNRIGDFWSYAVKHNCTLLVTTKNFQAELAKVLFHFYKGGMWYDRLSFYLAV